MPQYSNLVIASKKANNLTRSVESCKIDRCTHLLFYEQIRCEVTVVHLSTYPNTHTRSQRNLTHRKIPNRLPILNFSTIIRLPRLEHHPSPLHPTQLKHCTSDYYSQHQTRAPATPPASAAKNSVAIFIFYAFSQTTLDLAWPGYCLGQGFRCRDFLVMWRLFRVKRRREYCLVETESVDKG